MTGLMHRLIANEDSIDTESYIRPFQLRFNLDLQSNLQQPLITRPPSNQTKPDLLPPNPNIPKHQPKQDAQTPQIHCNNNGRSPA